MANYVPIPKDITKIKNKVVFGLTTRQLIGFGVAVLIGVPFMLVIRALFDVQAGMLAMFICGAPFVFISIYEKDEIPAEEWLRCWLRHKIRSYKSRKYTERKMDEESISKRRKLLVSKLKKEKKLIEEQKKEKKGYFRVVKVEKDNIFKSLWDYLKFVCNVNLRKLGKNYIISTQKSLGFEEMYKDGLCVVGNGLYSKTITFGDVNYRLAHKEEKNMIFSQYCQFLNSFGEDVHLQLTFINTMADLESSTSSVIIKMRDDGNNKSRKEYQRMLNDQIAKGSNGLVRNKYITFLIYAGNIREARQRLSRVENDAISIFNQMGVKSYSLTGKERLMIMSKLLNNNDREMLIDWERAKEKCISSKDFIAPNKMDFSNKSLVKIGKRLISTSQMLVNSTELSDEALAEFLDLEMELVVNIHLDPVEHQKSVKLIKRKITDIDRMKIDEQKKAVRAGYDTDVLPPDLLTYSEETKKILRDLQSQNEKWFEFTMLVTNISNSEERLEEYYHETRSIALKNNCDMKTYDYNQEDCLYSALPLGINKTYPRRGLVTSSVAVFIPFTTQELFQLEESVYYGLNAISNNVIMANRKALHNPNGLILGVPGSGKSFSAKREMTNIILVTDDNVIVCDPEGEYYSLIKLLGGQVVNVSPNSNHHVNPMDINLDYSEEDNPVTLKSDFVISLMELICGGRTGLTPIERSIIDRCVRRVYAVYFENPEPENMPILEDLYKELIKQDSMEAKNLADALEIYVYGSMKVFNNRTNVNITNRLVCFNIKELGKNLRKLGMLIIQDQVWNTVTINRKLGKHTWYYIDEFHLLLKDEQTAAYSVEIWKRFRKWGGIPTGITQNVKDLLASMEIENIFENSDFIYLLKQSPGDRAILCRKLGISNLQEKHIDNSEQGCGLIIYGGLILPHRDQFPKDTNLYKVMTTKLSEVKEAAEEIP